MPYIGQPPVTGDTTKSFRLLDNIASYTLTFDATSASVVSTTNDTLTFNQHRFVTAQRVTYNNGGGTAIGGLTSGTAYFIIKIDQNTIKLATSAANANAGTAIDLTSVGVGASHTLNVAFDGVNTKFKATYNGGTKASLARAGQLLISVNGVIQQPQESSSPTLGFGLEPDATIVFAVAPVSTDVVFGQVLADTITNFDITDNTVDNFTGNGSTTAFTLSKNVPNNQNVLVTLDGVVQYPSDTITRAYSVLNNILTFVSAPGNGVEIQVRHIGYAGATSSAVTGFYGRTGNVGLTTGDNVTVGIVTVSGITVVSAGSTAAPSITPVGDSNTGIFFPSADTIAFAEGGTEAARIDSSGRFGIGTNSVNTTLEVLNSSTPIIRVGDGTRHMELRGGSTTQNAAVGTNYNGAIDIIQNGTPAASIDTSKRLLVGTTSSRTTISASYPSLVQVETSAYAAYQAINNTNDATGAWLALGKSRGTSAGGVTVVQINDELGYIGFVGADGTDVNSIAAAITAQVDGTPGNNDMPGRLVFSTTADGASSPTERMRIAQNGVITAQGVYDFTTANAANVAVLSAGQLYRSTSSSKYKTNIETLQDQYADALLNCRPVWYRSTCEFDCSQYSWWGFIAEEVAAIDPRLVHWKTTNPVRQEDGSIEHVPCEPEPEGVAYDRFVPHLLNLIKRQQQAIETLEAKVAALESA